MRTTFITILTLITTLMTSAQTERELINQQVWIPFTEAWERRDPKALNALYTEDILRIDPKELLLGGQFKRRNLSRMANANGGKRTIEVAFDYRQIAGDIAYEMGFYRVKSDEESESTYTRFHVELRKVNGLWKISRSYNNSKIGTQRINPKMYAALKFIHFRSSQ